MLILLLSLSVLAAGWSLAGMVAAVAAWQADRLSTAAFGGGALPGGTEDQGARRRFATARRLEPASPLHPERLAAHLERMADRLPPGSARRPLLEEALALYIASVARRPTWPYTPAAALHTQFRLGRFGDDFTRGYVRAVAVGLGATLPRRSLVDLGLAAWPVLAPEPRALLLSLLRQELALDPRRILSEAQRLGRGALIEPLIADDPDATGIYRELQHTALHSGGLKTRSDAPR